MLDSQTERWEGNIEHFELLAADLASQGRNLETIPIVFQINKRDCPNILDADAFRRQFKTSRCLYVESIASRGIGVIAALEALISLVPPPSETR